MSVNAQLQWFKGLKETASYMAESNKIDFAEEIESIIHKKGLTRSELAKLIEVSPAYVTKVLKGDANVTIETMAKFAHALGKCLHFHLADKKAEVKWFDLYINSAHPVTSLNPLTVKVSAQRPIENWIKSKKLFEKKISQAKRTEHVG